LAIDRRGVRGMMRRCVRGRYHAKAAGVEPKDVQEKGLTKKKAVVG